LHITVSELTHDGHRRHHEIEMADLQDTAEELFLLAVGGTARKRYGRCEGEGIWTSDACWVGCGGIEWKDERDVARFLEACHGNFRFEVRHALPHGGYETTRFQVQGKGGLRGGRMAEAEVGGRHLRAGSA
jgi:hypothetical protein